MIEEALVSMAEAGDRRSIAQVMVSEACRILRAEAAFVLLPRGEGLRLIACDGGATCLAPGALVGRPCTPQATLEALERAGQPVDGAVCVPISLPEGAGHFIATPDPARAEFEQDDHAVLRLLAAGGSTALISRTVRPDERLRLTVDASERERRWWARELHDETLQRIIAVQVMLSTALRHGAADALPDVVEEAVHELHVGADNLRALISDQRPAALDQLGFVQAIEMLARRTGEIGRVETTTIITLENAWGRLTPSRTEELEVALYRVVQEACSNLVKHAKASRATIRIWSNDLAVGAEVEDDGIGFDARDGSLAGQGLLGMTERVALIGGELELASSPGRGTSIRFEMPLGRPGADSLTGSETQARNGYHDGINGLVEQLR